VCASIALDHLTLGSLRAGRSMRRPSASYSTAGFYAMPARRIVDSALGR